jgi:hypothetical protein
VAALAWDLIPSTHMTLGKLVGIGLLVLTACKGELSLGGLGGGKKTTPKAADSDGDHGSSSSGGGRGDRGGGGGGGEMTPPPKVGKLETGKAPPWCKGYEPSSTDSNIHWVKDYLEREGWSEKTISYVAKAACDKPRDGDRQAQVAEWAAAYKKALGASDQDFVELMSYGILSQEQSSKLENEQCASYKEKDEEASAEQKTLRNAVAAVLGCGRNSSDSLLWWLDRPQISEIQRTALINQCVQGDPEKDDKVKGEFAFCLVDFKKLDRAAFDKELASLELNLYGKTSAVQSFLTAKTNATFLLKKYEGLAQKDEDWKRLFEAPEKGYQSWIKEYEANKAAFDAVKKFDAKAAKGSKKAMAGCSEELRGLFLDHLAAAKKVKNIEQAKAAATDLVGYPLLVAMMRCDAAEERYLPVSAAEHLFMEQAKTHRGPRFEAYEASVTALNGIRADREKFPLERMYPNPPGTGRDLWYKAYEQTFNKINYDKPATGQIKTVKAKGDMTYLTFKTVSWKEEVAVNCRDTRKVYRIRDDGTLEYEQKCNYKTETMKSTEQPVSVPNDFAKGLAPGMMVELMIDNAKSGRVGIPSGVWKDTAKKKFIGTFGVIW